MARLAFCTILGSNVFICLRVVGFSAVVTPMSLAAMGIVDMIALILGPALLLVWSFTGSKCRIDRWEGAVMLLCFIAYYAYLFVGM